MPDHIHLVVFPLDEAYDMGIILKAIKLGATKCAQHLGLIGGSLWEPGGGHDRNVYTRQERLEKILYTHRNPARKGLVNDMTEYRWSSANWYLTGKQADIECHVRDELSE